MPLDFACLLDEEKTAALLFKILDERAWLFWLVFKIVCAYFIIDLAIKIIDVSKKHKLSEKQKELEREIAKIKISGDESIARINNDLSIKLEKAKLEITNSHAIKDAIRDKLFAAFDSIVPVFAETEAIVDTLVHDADYTYNTFKPIFNKINLIKQSALRFAPYVDATASQNILQALGRIDTYPEDYNEYVPDGYAWKISVQFYHARFTFDTSVHQILGMKSQVEALAEYQHCVCSKFPNKTSQREFEEITGVGLSMKQPIPEQA